MLFGDLSVNLKSYYSDWLEMCWSRCGWIVWISVDTYFIVTLKTPIQQTHSRFIINIWFNEFVISTSMNISGRSRDLAEALAASQRDWTALASSSRVSSVRGVKRVRAQHQNHGNRNSRWEYSAFPPPKTLVNHNITRFTVLIHI